MSTSNDVPFTQWAKINQNERFTATLPFSGYRRHLYEDEPNAIYLDSDPSEEAIGGALLKSLNASRFIHPREGDGFFNADRIIAADKRWHAEFMTRFGYKTLQQAYSECENYAARCRPKGSSEERSRAKKASKTK